MPDLSTVKDIASIAAPFTAIVVETWLKPSFTALLKRHKTEDALTATAFVERFADYLTRSYEKHSFMNTVVFPNQKRALQSLYQPLTINSEGLKKSKRIVDYPQRLMDEHRRMLLTDTAGMGKSTLLKFMFLKCVEQNAGIPVFVELRRLSQTVKLLDVIYEELNPLDDTFDAAFILARIKRGDFVFFLDGYDEIGFQDREVVTRDLRQFQNKAGKNTFIMSSRPENALTSFPDFEEFRVVPLQKEEAFALIRRYGEGHALAEQLIAKLETSSLKNIEEFLGNPLLVSLLYKSYEHKPTVPFKKHAFYRQVYDALFENHDLSKEGAFTREKASGLDNSDFHRVLRALGFETMKLGKIEYEKDQFLKLLRQIKPHCPGMTWKEDKVVQDLTTTVPLFILEGAAYRWAHKSIQDYFAAQFICEDAKDKQQQLLLSLFKSTNSTQYANVLDLCYDIDYKSFRRSILDEVCTELLHYADASYNAFQHTDIPPAALDRRRAITFQNEIALLSPAVEKRLLEGNAQLELNRTFQRDVDMSGLRISAYPHWGVHRRMALVLQGRAWEIFRLLAAKQSELIEEVKPSKAQRQMAWPRVARLLVDEDPDSPLNNARKFAIFTLYLCAILRTVPSLPKWRALRAELDAEIAREGEADYLIRGI